MLLSVIVPVYNSNVFLLDQCVHSIINQKGCDFELILVDDCSTAEATQKKLKEYSSNDRIHIFSTGVNGGPGKARNIGISKAIGDIIVFVDSDDTVTEDSFHKISDCFKNSDFDTVVFDYNVSRNGKIITERENRLINTKLELFSKSQIYKELVGSTKLNNIWRFAFSKKIIIENEIRFPEKIKNGEDYVFIVDYMNAAKKIGYCNYIIYNYTINNDGITQSFNLGKLSDASYTLKLRFKLLDTKIEKEDKNEVLESLVKKYTHVYFDYIALAVTYNNLPEVYILLNDKSTIRLLNISCKRNLETRLKGFMLRHHLLSIILYVYMIKESVKQFKYNLYRKRLN